MRKEHSARRSSGRRGQHHGNSNGNHSEGRGHQHNGGRHRRSRHHRQSFDSGNKRERIAVESGNLVLIDQFMLANPRFIASLSEIIDEAPEVKNDVVSRYGGQVISLGSGTYRIHRNPYKSSIIIHPEGVRGEECEGDLSGSKEAGSVLIDTRCLAMIDRELLDDNALLERYQQLWFSGQDKACRDLLRDNGGAVRYGFSRFSDDLKVSICPETNVIHVSGTPQQGVEIEGQGLQDQATAYQEGEQPSAE